MAKGILFARLAAKDLRRHLSEAALLFLVIAAAATTLTLGLVLHGQTSNPYNQTRARTSGPDVLANLSPSLTPDGAVRADANPNLLEPLEHAHGVVAQSGPYPTTFASLNIRGLTATALLEGRDEAPASVDHPVVTAGTWIRPGRVVVERSFATALGVHIGDPISLNGHAYRVTGIAVDAAIPPYPFVCEIGCAGLYGPSTHQVQLSGNKPGVIWLPRRDIARLASPDVGLSYLLNQKLADPGRAPAFADSHSRTPTGGTTLLVTPSQKISFDAAKLLRGPRTVLLAGSGLLVILALASVAVLVGGRLSEQSRRVGLLKAVGATPGAIASVLLVEHLTVTLVAAGAGLCGGRAIAPLLGRPSMGLLGTPGAPAITIATVATVIGVALGVSFLATVVPAVEAARVSTVDALSKGTRPPRRHRLIIAISTRLPAPLLLGVRLAARRPRRAMLGTLSVAVTVAGIVAILIEHLRLETTSDVVNPQYQRMAQVMGVITVLLVGLAAINAVLITWSTIIDNRPAAALSQALGASPRQITAALSSTQLLTALAGSILGIPLGIALLQVVAKSSDAYKLVPIWWYPTIILTSCLLITGLTAIPARIGARRPIARLLQAET